MPVGRKRVSSGPLARPRRQRHEPVSIPPDVMAQIGRRLAALRVKADLSTRALSERSGVSQTTIVTIERTGRAWDHPGQERGTILSTCSVVTLYSLAAALGVFPEFLICGVAGVRIDSPARKKKR